jgi:hypothetical protein
VGSGAPTKERYPFIDAELEDRLWPYIGGIANQNRMKALANGGTPAPQDLRRRIYRPVEAARHRVRFTIDILTFIRPLHGLNWSSRSITQP